MPMKEFIQLQPQEIQDIYNYFVQDITANPFISDDELITSLARHLSTIYTFTIAASLSIAAHLIPHFKNNFADKFVSQDPAAPATSEDGSLKTSPDSNTAAITEKDYELYKLMVSANPDATPSLKSLLLALIVVYRQNFHPNGWVKYDRRQIMYLAGLLTASSAEQQKITTLLHNSYGLEMQVVGSTNPFPCYRFDWCYNQPPVSSQIN